MRQTESHDHDVKHDTPEDEDYEVYAVQRNVKCYVCHEFGHYARECTAKGKGQKRTREIIT